MAGRTAGRARAGLPCTYREMPSGALRSVQRAMLARVAHCTAKPGQADEVARELLGVSAILAGFEGCEQYTICRRPDTDEVWVLERWSDRERMQAALALPEFREVLPRVQALVAEWAAPVDLDALG